MDQSWIEVRGATGMVKMPISRFVFKTEDPSKPDSRKSKLNPILLTILIVTVVLIIAFGLVYLVRRYQVRSRRTLSPSEMESMDKTDYTIIPQNHDDDLKHLKKSE